MTTEAPFDQGLQPERTLLAWRRTTLSLGLASAVGLRLTVEGLGATAVVVGVAGIALSIACYVGAAARYRRAHRSLTDAGDLAIGGLTMTIAAGVTAALAILGLVAIIGGGFW